MLGLCLVLVVTAGCAERPVEQAPPERSEHERSSTPRARRTEIVFTGPQGSRLPSGCTPRRNADRLLRFIDAFNAGDEKVLGDAVVTGGLDGWSVFSGPAGGEDFVARSLADLPAHLATRHSRGERVRLFMARSGMGRAPGEVTVSLLLTRSADDLRGPQSADTWIAVGEAELTCRTGRISFWRTVVTEESDGGPIATGLPCRKPRRWRPNAGQVIACRDL